jgi:small acid-soluble spore protein D (minor alpha/beta-type SASP)
LNYLLIKNGAFIDYPFFFLFTLKVNKCFFHFFERFSTHVSLSFSHNKLIAKTFWMKGGIKMTRSSNKLLVPGVEQYLDQVKFEIAQEFGVQLGSDTVSRSNGSVGGEITKRLVKQAQSQLSGK